MKYNTLVRSNENFHASVNLQFDLNKTEKIDMYIPTLQSVLILKRYLYLSIFIICLNNFDINI